MSRPLPRNGRRRDGEVVEAAARIFYERGYADASVQDIADALGILKGSLYHYIDSKEDLLFRVLDEVHLEVEDILGEVAGHDELGPLDRLRLYVRRQVAYNAANLERIAVYYNDVERLGEARRAEIFARRKVHERFVRDLIVEAQERGDADAALDAGVLSNLVFATIIWIYRWYRPGGKVSRERLADLCSDFVLRGVVGPAGR